MRKISLPATCFIIFCGLLCPISGEPATIKVLSSNLTSGYHQAYEEPGINILRGLKPDIVLIQEFNYEQGSISSFVDDFFGEEFSYYREPDRGLPNGIISRWPIKSAGWWDDTNLSDREFVWAVIDIPGEKDLQAVSVHLKAGDGSSDFAKRAAQAAALKGYIGQNFDPDQYIVVGGDFNLQDLQETALDTFQSFLNSTNHIPVDTRGFFYTNRDQTKLYDWIMPNAILDARHTALIIGETSFPNGLVFNSWYYSPLTDVVPVTQGDSLAIGMQHLAVMKAFEIPSNRAWPPPGDYDGDGTSDTAVFRPSVGLWLVRGITRVYFGASGDTPVPQDYDGDGTWDPAYFRPDTGLWKVKGITRLYFGTSSNLLLPGDYDGDSTAEPAGFSPTEGIWKVRNLTRLYFGASDDIPAPADFDGDGSREFAWFRPSNGLWKVWGLTRFYFGEATDIPLCADYDGDGSDDVAWFRPGSGLWKVRNLTQWYFGSQSDYPIPGDYDGDGTMEPTYFRPGDILWKTRDLTRFYFGQSSDSPTSNPYVFWH